MPRPLLTLPLLFIATSGSAQEPAPTFEADVRPLLQSHCVKCHGAKEPKHGLDLRSRATIVRGGKSGPAIKPGSLRESPLWTMISTDRMPFGSNKLSEEQKDLLRRWILAGAPGEGVAPLAATSEKENPRSGIARKQGVDAVVAAIDRAAESRLSKEKIPLSPQADDAEFLRRIYLDLTGRIPSLDEAKAFLDSDNAQKRKKLIDELLEGKEYAAHFAETWAKLITAEEPTLQDGLAVWLREGFSKNRGWNATVSDLLTATGKGPETAFIRANVDNKKPQPSKLAGSTARLFLGVQLQCAECHNHPFAAWKQTDFWGVAAFFSRVQEQTKPMPVGIVEAAKSLNNAKPPRKGKTLAPVTPPAGAFIVIPDTAGPKVGTVVSARFLGVPTPKFEDQGPVRPALADWLTSAENRMFAEAAVNRWWAMFFGRGLVHPVDDFHDENEPSLPSVMRVLADEFRATGYDLKHLVRCICNTKAYQRSSRTVAGNEDDLKLLSHHPVRVMAPEALHDSLLAALQLKALKVGAPPATSTSGRSVKKESTRQQFVRLFNTSESDADATEYTQGIPQVLNLLNDPIFNQPMPLVDKMVKAGTPPDQAITDLYLTLLSRRPDDAERKLMQGYLKRRPDPRGGYAGIVWILVNSPEFVMVR